MHRRGGVGGEDKRERKSYMMNEIQYRGKRCVRASRNALDRR